MPETTSIRLIQRLQSTNETHSWDQFFLIYRPFILGWLIRQGVHECDAGDIQQDVMCKVLSELPGFRHNGSVGAFRCWLRLVTVNQLRRHRRRCRHSAETDFDKLASALACTDTEINRKFDAEHDHHLLSALLGTVEATFSESTILAFRLTALDSFSPSEAAEQLGISRGAVIAGKSRVLCRLREVASELFDADR